MIMKIKLNKMDKKENINEIAFKKAYESIWKAFVLKLEIMKYLWMNVYRKW